MWTRGRPMDAHRLGGMTISRVIEREGPGMAPQMLLPDYDPAVFAEHESWLAPRYWDPVQKVLVSSVHGWVFRTKHHTVLVDTCIGNDKERPTFARFHRLK